MAGVNKCIFIGNLGKDPEVRHLDSGRAVANFSIAISEKYKKKDGTQVDNTEWINIVLWSPLAEIAEKYLKKGNQVYIEGKYTTRSYDSDGTTKYITDIIGREITLLGGKQEGQVETNTTPTPTTAEADDLPF